MIVWLLIGELAIGLRERSAVPSVLELLRQHHVSDTFVAVAISALPALFGAFVGPVISYFSDRYRSRWGRRIPFILATTPVCALSLAGLAYCGQLGRGLHQLLGSASPGEGNCIITWFCILWTIFQCTAVMTAALYSGLVNDVVPHRILGRFYAGVRMVSLGAGVIFNLWIFEWTETHLHEVFLMLAALFGGGVILMSLKVHEGEEVRRPSAQPVQQRPWDHARAMLRAYRDECFGDRYYVFIFVMFMLAAMSFIPFNTFSQYYSTTLGLSKKELGTLLAVVYGASLFLSFGIGWCVDRYGALRICSIVLTAYALISLTAYLGRPTLATFPVVYVLHGVVSGAWFTASASLPMALFPQDRFLQFNSAKDLVASAGGILTSILLGPLLDYSGHDYSLTLLIGALAGGASALCIAMLYSRRQVAISTL